MNNSSLTVIIHEIWSKRDLSFVLLNAINPNSTGDTGTSQRVSEERYACMHAYEAKGAH